MDWKFSYLCRHGNVQEIISQGVDDTEAFWWKPLRKLLRDIISGLKFLHDNDVVHLDIKPENILLSKSKKYKIGDLGLVRIYNKCADFDEGDCRYLAPELLNASSKSTDLRKADIFSAGVMIYELMEGMILIQVPNCLKMGQNGRRSDQIV